MEDMCPFPDIKPNRTARILVGQNFYLTQGICCAIQIDNCCYLIEYIPLRGIIGLPHRDNTVILLTQLEALYTMPGDTITNPLRFTIDNCCYS
jgi:hypothetical protein